MQLPLDGRHSTWYSRLLHSADSMFHLNKRSTVRIRVLRLSRVSAVNNPIYEILESTN